MTTLRGTYTVTITPFTADGRKVEVSVLRDFVDWQIEQGAHGLIPVASTGEFLSLADDERRQVAGTVIDQANGRVPVLVGAGAENTWDVVRYSREAEDLGADGLLIIPPFYSTPTEEEVYRHYNTVGEAVSIPVMLYNNPATSNIDMQPPLIARLSEIDNVSYIKESTLDATRVRDIIHLSGDRMAVFGGIMGYESFLNGAIGWTAVGCNLMPRAFSDMYRHCVESEDLDAAKNLYREILPVIDLVGQHRYVSATKKALDLMGLPVGPPRPPRLPASGEDLAWTERVVRDLGLTFR
ncbi:MAG: dihydrodipicolinate synthase family protein [Rhodospirillaceae bacterium]|nr:dihydrodipicolinate synthase family protein [Rhodospirillaceae bacterium]MDD9998919.1 dihydrodipicolinate synthase family protein [Rhodospirillaceae bacterium]